ncbi:MAG: hypothetical protein KY443_06035, partial [Actinobacteria bacterium]|nr:hypothetical protein [Actinomycetota bacterium]
GGGAGGGRGGLSADKSKCAKDGIRQQDVTITSPPCVPRWTGPNGGATYQGVDEKTVTVLHYRTEANAQVDAILQTQGLASSPTEEATAREAFAKFFEKRYEFYGRTIKWVFHQGKCRTTPPDLPCYRREARELNRDVKPFAVFWINSTVQAEFFDQWSEMGVINVGGWHFHNDFFLQNRPYHWDVFMDGTRTTQNLADYWCKKLQGKNATLAGDPTFHTKRRKVGIVTQNYEYTKRNAVDFVNAVRGGMCGEPGDAAEPVYTPSDIGQAQQTAHTAMHKLKEDGVTTVVFLSDPIGPRFFTNAATADGWYPEHLLSGAGLIDYDVLGRLYEPSQWVNAFGPGHLAEPIPFNQSDAARAAADVGVNHVYSGANLLFAYMHVIAVQVQMAGPNLNPSNVERAMLSLPASGGWERTKNPAAVLVKWGPGDYTAIQDSRHAWWDPRATSKIDGKTGAYRAVQGGRRWEIGTWGPEPLVKQ